MDVPCFGCTDRTENCHSECLAYKEYKQKFTAEKEKAIKVRNDILNLDKLRFRRN